MTIEAVIFDWGGTLTPWHAIDLEEQWRVYARLYAKDHPEYPDGGGDLARRMLDAERSAWMRLRENGASARLADIYEIAGVDPAHPQHDAAHAAYEEFWEPHTLTDPLVAPLFTGLRERGVKVGVLSNTVWSGEYHDKVFARDGVADLIDGAVYTSEIDHVKPHPKAFELAMAAVGAQDPSRCVYVGDRVYEDVFGSQRAGMRAVLVPHSDVPADQRVEVTVTPDGVAHTLLDVLDLVDGWNASTGR